MITASTLLGYVWHTCIWGVSPILLCRSFQALSGWMGSVTAQLFSGFSRDIRSGSSPGSGWATQGYLETCPKATPKLSWLFYLFIYVSPLFNHVGQLRTSSHLQLQPGQDKAKQCDKNNNTELHINKCTEKSMYNVCKCRRLGREGNK